MADATRDSTDTHVRVNTPIAALPLSNRTRARLGEAGIETAADLESWTDADLLTLRGFGHTCLREVRSVLHVFHREHPVASSPEFPVDVPAALRETPLANLPISNRARRVFEREGIVTVAEYVARGEERLLGLRNFGETTLTSVNRAIHAAIGAVGDGNDDANIFRSPERVDESGAMHPEAAHVPIAALDLPRRARRACRDLGVRTLSDLTSLSTSDLLHRRNFGQATLRRIQVELDRYLQDVGAAGGSGFATVLRRLLERLQPKERQLIELREGFGGEAPCTLTEAGRRMGITESRACQIEHSAWSKLKRFSVGEVDAASECAVERLLAHGGVAPPAVLIESPYFQDGDVPPECLGRLLGRLLPHRLARLSDGRLAAVPAATLYTLAARLKKRLRRTSESVSLRSLAGDVLRGLDVPEPRETLVRALCEVLFHREIAPGPDGENLVRTPSQGLGDDLRRILVDAGEPLHYAEIARRIALAPFGRTDLNEEKVRLRLCRDDRFVLIQRGLYDLRERFSVAPEVREQMAARAMMVLRAAHRPTSVALIVADLKKDGLDAAITEFVLAAVLRDDDRFRHLGRGTFVPAAEGDKQVHHVSEILESVLTESGGPLTYAELRRRVQERRKVSDGAISATLVGRRTFLRVARGKFDLASRHPYDDSERIRIAQEARTKVDEAGGVTSLDVLVASLTWPDDAAPSAILLGDLLRRQGGFRFLGGGYVAAVDDPGLDAFARRAAEVLRQNGDALRPTTIGRRLGLSDAAIALLRVVLKEDRRFVAYPEGRFGLSGSNAR